jgi:sulfur carrier protein
VKILVNGEKISLPEDSNIEGLIVHLGFQNQRIAIEINESIIPKSNHSSFLLQDLDKVEIINAVGGG